LGSILNKGDCIVPIAAHAHIMRDGSFNPLSDFWNINIEGTFLLARQAAKCGV
jgi:hypothetical protein